MSTDAEQYAREWAAMTGRQSYEIYIPNALRESSEDAESFRLSEAQSTCPHCGATLRRERNGGSRIHASHCKADPK